MSSLAGSWSREERSPCMEALESRLLLSGSSEACGFDGEILGSGDATPEGQAYLLWEDWGGHWADAEKSPDTSDDDLLCWAAAASNVLEWTGWGLVDSMSSADDIFAYYQDHWSNAGSEAEYAWNWWFDGYNKPQGVYTYAQVIVPGGAFYPEISFSDYFRKEGSTLLALQAVDTFLQEGCGTVLSLRGMGGHAVTCWGFQYDPAQPGEYLGVWITDSDDDKEAPDPPDSLQYYQVDYRNGRWHLLDYSASDMWYIHSVQALARVGDALENHPPELTDPTVTPLLADEGQACEFTVHYRDPDGDAPSAEGAVCLLTGGLELDMALVSGMPEDGVYACQATLPTGSYQHLFRFTDESGLDAVLGWRPGPYVDLRPGNDMSVVEVLWDDTFGGDNDSAPEPGENLELGLRLASGSDVTEVFATLSADAEELSILRSGGVYGAIGAGQSAWCSEPFRVQAAHGEASEVAFVLDVSYLRGGQRHYQRLTFSQGFSWRSPEIQVDHVVVHDPAPGGDDDGVAESGEAVELDLYLRNVGTSVARGFQARLRDLSFGDAETTWLDFGELLPGAPAIRQSGRFAFESPLPVDLLGTVTGTVVARSQDEAIVLESDRTLFDVQPAAWIVVEPGQWDFGVCGTQEGVVRQISVRNPGTGNLRITDVSESHADTDWAGDRLPWTIAPGGEKTFDVTIDTSALRGSITREIVLLSNGRAVQSPLPADRATISGTVTDAPPDFPIPGTDAACASPDVSGSRVVYLQDGSVHLFEIDTRDLSVVVPADGVSRRNLRISEDLVAWEQDGPAGSDIYACHLAAPTPFPVANSDAEELLLGVDAGWVAYVAQDFSFPYWSEDLPGRNVYGYDTSTNTSSRLTDYVPPTDGQAALTVSTGGDFSDGVITWHRESHGWLGSVIGWSDTYRLGAEKLTMGLDVAPVLLSSRAGESIPATAGGKVFWCQEDPVSPHDEQVWVWEDGSSRRVTTEADDPYTDHLDPIAGEGFVVHRKSGREELFWTDVAGETKGPATQNLATGPRADGHCLVWAEEGIRYTFLVQPDLSVNPADIAFGKTVLSQGQLAEATITVHNMSPWDAAGDVSVELERVPASGDPEPWAQAVIPGGVRPRSQESVPIDAIIPDDWLGACETRVRVSSPDTEYPHNNAAGRWLNVLDSDVSGPEITHLVVEEYGGDGDGLLGSDESVRIAWDIADASGIASVWLYVDDHPVEIDPGPQAILPPLAPGTHSLRIEAEDGDPCEPSTTTVQTAFEVVAAEEITLLYDGTPLQHDVSHIDLGSFTQGTGPIQKVLILRNDGRQALALGTVTAPQGFEVVPPATSLLNEGASTHMILRLDTSLAAIRTGLIQIPSSDADENPFRFELTARVLPTLPGDGNADGFVTDADYTIWADHYGLLSEDGPAIGDFNLDGEVSDADYTLWADHYSPPT